MNEWYLQLSGFQQTLFMTGVFSTLVFAIQFAMTLFGVTGTDLDVDDGSDGATAFDFGDIFTIRNGVTFLMGFSWGGLMAHDWGLTHPAGMVAVGALVGSTFVGVTIALFLGMSRLRADGNIRLENAIAEQATVTLAIPARRSGVGKVRVTVQGRLKEYHAVTDGDALSRNTQVTVMDLVGSQLVVAGTPQ